MENNEEYRIYFSPLPKPELPETNDFKAINRYFLQTVDKFYRMHVGIHTELLDWTELRIKLKMILDSRFAGNAEQAVGESDLKGVTAIVLLNN